MSDIIERAEAVLEGVYEAPWIQVGLGNIHTDPVGNRPPVAKTWTRANGEFVAAARTLVPELVAELKAARADNRRLLEAWQAGFAEGSTRR